VPPKVVAKVKPSTVPHSAVPATKKAVGGLLWILLFLQFSRWYNVPLILSDEYLKYGFPYRVWILQLLGFTSRLKYYGVWSLTEGACIMAGIAYNGVDEKTGKAKWGKSRRVLDLLDNSLPPRAELAAFETKVFTVKCLCID
jgi:lysophospholipid acyltransferase